MTTTTFKKRPHVKKRTICGGRVIASGGYGCIFRPALKCVSKSRPKNEISKLMTNKHVKEEYDDIVRFKPFLEKIPNYNYYFFIDGVYTCKPDKLTDDDLKDYEKKCKALKKDGFSVKNINDSLEKIELLNMPDGGLDVGDFIVTITKGSQFITLNNSLIDLLLNGIIPMNKYEIYHCDIKESNILVDTKEGFHTKLIDWGLSSKYNGTEIPDSMFERPFQYNLPFSIILFNDTLKKMYQKILDNNPKPNYYTIRAFVIDYIFLWNEKRGPGHIKYMIGMMESLFENDVINIDYENRKEIIEMEFLYYYIIEYLTKILMKFTKDGEFMLMDYFNNIFLKNIDVWGLVMTYYPIINILHENFSQLDKLELKLFNKLKYIFIHYLFENSTEPIQVSNLVEELKELNVLFKRAEKNDQEKSITSLVKKSSSKTKTKTKTDKRTSQKNKKQPRTMLFIESKK
jgi:serine/threonine protein kinase